MQFDANFWGAIEAIGALMAGIAAVVAMLNKPVRALITWLAYKWANRKRGSSAPRVGESSSSAVTLTTILVLAAAVVGGVLALFHQFPEVPEIIQLGIEPPSAVCQQAKRTTYPRKAARTTLTQPTGIWRGKPDWTDSMESWSFNADGTLEIGGGLRGEWTYRNTILTMTVNKTRFSGEVIGEVFCGYRSAPGGSFQMEHVSDTPRPKRSAKIEAPEEVEAAPENAAVPGNLN